MVGIIYSCEVVKTQQWVGQSRDVYDWSRAPTDGEMSRQEAGMAALTGGTPQAQTQG